MQIFTSISRHIHANSLYERVSCEAIGIRANTFSHNVLFAVRGVRRPLLGRDPCTATPHECARNHKWKAQDKNSAKQSNRTTSIEPNRHKVRAACMQHRNCVQLKRFIACVTFFETKRYNCSTTRRAIAVFGAPCMWWLRASLATASACSLFVCRLRARLRKIVDALCGQMAAVCACAPTAVTHIRGFSTVKCVTCVRARAELNIISIDRCCH